MRPSRRPALHALLSQAALHAGRLALAYRAVELGLGPVELGAIAAAFAVLPMLLALPLGRLGGRLTRVGALPAGGAAAIAIAAALGIAATTLPALLLASALLGLGGIATHLGAQSWLTRTREPDALDAAFGALSACMAIGQGLGPLAVGVVQGAVGSTAALAVVGALGIGALVAACSRAPAPPEGARREAMHAIAILRRPGVPRAMAVGVALVTTTDVLTAFLPLVADSAGIAPAVVGVLLATRAAASVASRALLGRLLSRIHRDALVAASLLGTAAMVAAVAVPAPTAILAAAMLLGGFLLGIGQPLSMTSVALAVPAHSRSSALAVRLLGNRIAQAAIPAVAGALGGSLGVGAVLWTQLAIVGAAAAWTLPDAVGSERRRRHGPPDEAEDDER